MSTNSTGSTRRYDGALRWASDAVLGAFYRVYNELGTGFLESVYEAAMVVVLRGMRIHVERQAPVSVHFRGTIIGSFKIDLLVECAIAVELKASRKLDSAHEAQLLNYLRASDLEVGLLLNFGDRPSFKRLAYSNERKLLKHRTVDDGGSGDDRGRDESISAADERRSH
jgi:GxxExxY protein